MQVTVARPSTSGLPASAAATAAEGVVAAAAGEVAAATVAAMAAATAGAAGTHPHRDYPGLIKQGGV